MGDFLLNIWREASSQAGLEQSVERIAVLTREQLPADQLVLLRFDVGRLRLDIVTAAASDPHGTTPVPRFQCTPDDFSALVTWCRGGRVLRSGDAPAPIARVFATDADRRAWMAGPLRDGAEPSGVLLATAARGRAFSGDDEALFAGILEPVSIALATSQRLQTLARHNEAMEADNRLLLSRLDRQNVSDAIVGAEGGLRPVMDRIKLVAPTDAPVLIIGETGSGKEVLARAIHTASQRKNGPVVRVNCGALPPGLIDSELFGHERGSFTGATNVRRGWFERADGGTLFLDEIGDLPLDAQVRLLRILQDGTFERVGGSRPLRVDVRIVAATHCDLQAMVAAGTFREDLWYRISVFPVHLPALRDRVEDIPALAAHFAWRVGKRLGGVPLSPTRADLELLAGYAWPGNVRELAAVIERAAILGDGRQLMIAAALGTAGRGRGAERRVPPPAAAVPAPPRLAPLDTVIVQHIEAALSAANGRVEGPSGAAAQLGINPHTLRARMRKLGIDWSRFRQSRAQAGDRA
jgi:transcriptional regulator with GAF, ATPase, and Fis domain